MQRVVAPVGQMQLKSFIEAHVVSKPYPHHQNMFWLKNKKPTLKDAQRKKQLLITKLNS